MAAVSDDSSVEVAAVAAEAVVGADGDVLPIEQQQQASVDVVKSSEDDTEGLLCEEGKEKKKRCNVAHTQAFTTKNK